RPDEARIEAAGRVTDEMDVVGAVDAAVLDDGLEQATTAPPPAAGREGLHAVDLDLLAARLEVTLERLAHRSEVGHLAEAREPEEAGDQVDVVHEQRRYQDLGRERVRVACSAACSVSSPSVWSIWWWSRSRR